MGKRIPLVIREPQLQQDAESESEPHDQDRHAQEEAARNSPSAAVSIEVGTGKHQTEPDGDENSHNPPEDFRESIVQRYYPSPKAVREALAIASDIFGVALPLWAFFTFLWTFSFQGPEHQTLVLPNRPKFALQPVSHPLLVAGQPMRFEFVLKNIGRSSALSPEPCGYHVVAALPDASFVVPPCSEAERTKLRPATQHVPVQPNNVVVVPFVVTLSEAELYRIRGRRAALYLYEEMAYRDLAGNSYSLSFCFFVTGEENGALGVCPKGNVND